MKYQLMKALYDNFYVPLDLPKPQREADEAYEALLKTTEESEQKLMLQLIDAKNLITTLTSIDSFITGFELAWSLSMELKCYENEGPNPF